MSRLEAVESGNQDVILRAMDNALRTRLLFPGEGPFGIATSAVEDFESISEPLSAFRRFSQAAFNRETLFAPKLRCMSFVGIVSYRHLN